MKIVDKFVEVGNYIDEHKKEILYCAAGVGAVAIGFKLYKTGFNNGCIHGAQKTCDKLIDIIDHPDKYTEILKSGEAITVNF